MASLATMAIFTSCRSTPFKMRVLKQKGMEEAELKKKGPLGVRLVEGLRLPALHIVRQISGEARELYLAGAREHGPLSRQYGEAMSMYILCRRTWWSLLQDLASKIKLPELILAEKNLNNAKISDDQM